MGEGGRGGEGWWLSGGDRSKYAALANSTRTLRKREKMSSMFQVNDGLELGSRDRRELGGEG